MRLNPFSRRVTVAPPAPNHQLPLSMSTLPTLLHSQPPLPPHSLPTPPASPPSSSLPIPYPQPVDPSINPFVSVVEITDPNEKIKWMDRPMIKLVKDDVMVIYKYIRGMDWRRAIKLAVRRSMYKWYAIVVIAVVLTALLSAKHDSIVEFCRPISRTIRDLPGGFMIPILILILLSFPPLVGHEVIGILIGLVYGIGVGFAILAAGTFLGEIATWIAFKWCCQTRAAKFEKQNKLYSVLTQLIREKSFMFVLVLRFSAVPGHITTAVSASAGANFWMYLLAAFLTLPKQFTIVYLGQAYGEKSFKNTMISTVATVITLLGTVVAAVYIYYQMRMVMIRNELMLPTVVPSAAGPTWADVGAGGPMDGPRGSIALSSDEKDPNLTIVDGGSPSTPQPHRSWLHAAHSHLAPSNSIKAKALRARSLPGPLSDEEYREWMNELEYESGTGLSTPGIRVDENGDDKMEQAGSLPQFSPEFLMSSRIPTSRLAQLSPTPSSNALLPPSEYTYIDSDTTAPDTPTSSGTSYPPPRTSWGDISRGRTASLEIARPKRNSRSLGGRELADEADAYAVRHGQRRPDYGRFRGESRAALLGRPTDDDISSDGGSLNRL